MAGYILDQSKFLFIDARSYTAAWANRTKGGGFEATGKVFKILNMNIRVSVIFICF